MMEKNGMLTEDSKSDFDLTKKAAYYDEAGFGVADEGNKDKLKKPVRIDKGNKTRD
jgi:hypothetical protein